MIPTLRDWLSGTDRPNRARSAELLTLDAAIGSFHNAPSDHSRVQVGVAWKQWKKKHTSSVSSFVANERNVAGLFEVLDAEFRTVDKAPPRGAMSRLELQLPKKIPIGFANIDQRLALDRLDKAFAEAQAMLRLVVHRVTKADAGVTRLAKLWFGTTPLAQVGTRFDTLLDHMACRMQNGLSKVKLKYTDTVDDANQGIAHVKVKMGNTDTIWFSTGFFSDERIVPLIGLTSGAPVPQDQHVKQTLEAAQAHAALLEQLVVLRTFTRWTSTAPLDVSLRGAVETAHAKAALRRNPVPPPLDEWLGLCKTAQLDLAGPASAAFKWADAKVSRVERKIQERDAAGLGLSHGFKTSSAGVVLHELTHLVLHTEDEERPDFVGKDKRCYGPIRCAALADVAPEKAFTNADSYRLFAESCVVA